MKTKRKMCNASAGPFTCHLSRHGKRRMHCDLVQRKRWFTTPGGEFNNGRQNVWSGGSIW